MNADPSTSLKPADAEEAKAFFAAHPDVDMVHLLLPDTNGILRGKWGPPDLAMKAFKDGVQLPYSLFGLDVWGREVPETGLHIETGDKDGTCFAVPGSLKRVPWSSAPAAQLMMAMYTPEGEPFPVDPRHVLAAIERDAADRGVEPVMAFELEFYLLKPDFETDAMASPLPHMGHKAGPERQQMYAMSALGNVEEFLLEVRSAAVAQGIPVDALVSEAGPGQFEVNLLHRKGAMAAADDAILLRRLISGVARKHGHRASFMAKPFQDWPGNGMHVHMSLADADGGNVFAAAESGEAKLHNAIAGVLETMPEMLALFINSYNGYRRLAPGSYAPTRTIWGADNRSVAIRVPAGSPKARRFEHRIAGADAHPHLVAAAVLAGAMHGLDRKLTPPEPVTGNAYDDSGAGDMLTDDMGVAVSAFEGSTVVAGVLPAQFIHVFEQLKRAEEAVFDERISRLEHDTYL